MRRGAIKDIGLSMVSVVSGLGRAKLLICWFVIYVSVPRLPHLRLYQNKSPLQRTVALQRRYKKSRHLDLT